MRNVTGNPTPAIIEHTDAAKRLLVDTRQEAEAEYAKAEAAQDAVGTMVWGRVSEHVRKLALLYAISANHLNPSIDADAVRWATKIVMHQTRRMLFMAARTSGRTLARKARATPPPRPGR